MNNIVLISDTANYPYHSRLCNLIQSLSSFKDYTFSHIDRESGKRDSILSNEITALSPDLVITLDLAGFHSYTQLGEIALNLLPAKLMNLIWGNKPEYSPLLSKKLSLSMHFFDCSPQTSPLMELYPYMEYCKHIGSVITEKPLETHDAHNKSSLEQISRCFLQEIQV